MEKFKIIHLLTSVSRASGGLFDSVRHLGQEMIVQDGKFQVEMISARDKYLGRDIEFWKPLEVRTHVIWGPKRFAFAPGMTTDLLASEPALVHLHGIWQYPSVAALRWKRRTGKPLIVSPHGMLEPWSLQQSPMKKNLAGWLYQWPCLKEASCLRATSFLEAQSIRLAGFKKPIAVIPNGIVVPPLMREAPKRMSNVKRALFLSRIHPKKGILNLVKAWCAVKPADWELLIVGPDECGHLAEVKAAVHACGLEKQIQFQGEVIGEAKIKCYRDADLFVLPTFSENFGLVIAEALSYSLPVITTTATPWNELETHNCGWWIPIGVEPLVNALRSAMALSNAERSIMGNHGRQLIENHYTWPSIGRRMCAVYDWMLGLDSKPECVVLP